MTKPKILVTRRWPAAAEDYIREHYDTTINMGERLTKELASADRGKLR